MNREPRQTAIFDPGWLFLLSGLALLGATLLIPAAEDLEEARWLRDRALAVEAHREERLARYEEYLNALEEREPSLVLSLVASQLNQVPEGRAALDDPLNLPTNASVFPALEPPPLKLAEWTPKRSILSRWTNHDRSRLWLVAAGAACVLVGLLPASRGWRGAANRHPYLENTPDV